jgi:hypothetical protein
MIPTITRGGVRGQDRTVEVRKKDVTFRKPEVGNERLKGGSSK